MPEIGSSCLCKVSGILDLEFSFVRLLRLHLACFYNPLSLDHRVSNPHTFRSDYLNKVSRCLTKPHPKQFLI